MPSSVTDPSAGPGRSGLDDAALVGLLARGQPDALGELYERHGAACYRLARQVTANAALAEDAVQEAFTGMWRDPGAYSPGRGTSVRTWLLGLTHHKAVDFVRRETSQQRRQQAQAVQRAFEPPATDDPAAITWQRMRAAEVRAAVGELPDAQRQTLALAYFGGYTQREIAELTNVPLGTVKTRTFSAMRRLRLRLAPLASIPGEGTP
jgi:RNA polymerase sigma factor (sigma-70 family)